MLRIEVEHLRAGAEREAETGDDGGALEPAAAWSTGDQVAPPVGGRDVDGVAGGLGDALGSVAGPVAGRHGLVSRARQPRAAAVWSSRAELGGRLLRDQPTSLLGVLIRQQTGHRDVGEG